MLLGPESEALKPLALLCLLIVFQEACDISRRSPGRMEFMCSRGRRNMVSSIAVVSVFSVRSQRKHAATIFSTF